jgi:16S rRNA processing protein RimM
MQEGQSNSKQQSHQGSPERGEPFFLAVGQLRRPHGLRGEILMVIYTDFPERIELGMVVYLGERHKPSRILNRRMHNNGILLTFEGYPDRTAVEILRNLTVYIPVDSIPELPEGEYYHHELLGMITQLDTGEILGAVVDILETGANDVLVIKDQAEQEILLPLIDDVVKEINLETGVILVTLLPGLLPGRQET